MTKYDLIVSKSIPVTDGNVIAELTKLDRVTKSTELNEVEVYTILRNSILGLVDEYTPDQRMLVDSLPNDQFTVDNQANLGKIMNALECKGIRFSLLKLPDSESEETPIGCVAYFITNKKYDKLPNCREAIIREYPDMNENVSTGEILLSAIDIIMTGPSIIPEILNIDGMKTAMEKAKSVGLNYYDPELLHIYKSYKIEPLILI